MRLGREGVRLGREGVRLGREGVRLGREGVRLGREGVRLGREGVRLGRDQVPHTLVTKSGEVEVVFLPAVLEAWPHPSAVWRASALALALAPHRTHAGVLPTPAWPRPWSLWEMNVLLSSSGCMSWCKGRGG